MHNNYFLILPFIKDPRGELLPVNVAAFQDEPTRAVVQYTPRSVGNHQVLILLFVHLFSNWNFNAIIFQISIKWNGQPIAGSPFTAKAFDANCVKLALDAENKQVGNVCENRGVNKYFMEIASRHYFYVFIVFFFIEFAFYAIPNFAPKVGRACTFTIDAAKAGAGNMEIIVSVGKKNVPNYVQPEGPARFRVSFTPQQPQEHVISVKFNGVPVPG